ncbi:MAG: hypothetical protein VZQ84_00655 [Anaerovoracaceae bacterium]|nr:hypothetical protein [Anaerovoracaceae bacterium]
MESYPSITMRDEHVGIRRFIELSLILIYKTSLEFVLANYIVNEFSDSFSYSFDLLKYITGVAVILMIFYVMPKDLTKPSAFFLEMHYLIGIIPITVIYAFCDFATEYYLTVCASFVLAALILRTDHRPISVNSRFLCKVMIGVFYLTILVVCLDIVYENGMFSLKALSLSKVYLVRRAFRINKYIGYLFEWQITIIIPFFMADALERRKYFRAVVFSGIQFVTYLYSGHKVVLFSIPLVIFIYYFIKKIRDPKTLYFLYMAGIALLTLVPKSVHSLMVACSLFVRRVLLFPAELKFVYYDYFSSHKPVGFEGTVLFKVFGDGNEYSGGVGHVIASHYFGDTEMNANTGFMVEGFYRFGFIGIVIVFLLFALMLYLLDSCAKKNGFALTLTISVFSIYMLNDLDIIGSMIQGYLFVLICICIFYNKEFMIKKKTGVEYNEHTQQ